VAVADDVSQSRGTSGDLVIDEGNQPPAPNGVVPSARRWRVVLLAGAVYLLFSLIIWSHIWTSHPTSTFTCGCGDGSLVTWYLEWPAYAISHGLNPLYSRAMFYPTGVNLLANASSFAIGMLLAPITWLFGPVATLNVAVTLSPAFSSLAMFVLLRRWVSWAPAAFFGGLFYGFSPFLITNLTDAHFFLGMAVVPPLVVACLDELLIRQRSRPVVTGIVLGLLITLQFFLSTEVLLITTIMGVVGLVLVLGYACWKHFEIVRQHAHYATVGLLSGIVTAGVLLAYPAWFALAGPAHLSGQVWSFLDLKGGGNSFNHLFVPESPAAVRAGLGITSFGLSHATGGYQGAILSPQYFGLGVFAVLVAGLFLWRHDRRLWMFGGFSLVSLILSFGAPKGSLDPWQALANLPEFDNVVPSRFILITYLSVAVMLGLIVEHTYQSLRQRRERSVGVDPDQRWSRLPKWSAAAAGVIVAGLAIVPPAAYLAQNLPISTEPLVVPTWFAMVAPHLRGDQVVLTFPSGAAPVLIWQAVDNMQFSIAEGGGPQATFAQEPEEIPGVDLLGDASISYGIPYSITPSGVLAVRRDLDDWKVTTVVIPDEPGLPVYDQIPSVTVAAALVTAATGKLPVHQSDAWVWAGVNLSSPPVAISTERFSQCTSGLATHGFSAVDHAISCVRGTKHST
jgi:hypothetical protein